MAVDLTQSQDEQTEGGLAALRVLLPGTMSVPDQSGPFERSWLRLAFVVAVVVGYAFLSLALAPGMGTSTGVLAVIPVTIGGLMFGTRGGALVGLAAIPSNALLIDLAGGGNNGVIIGVADLPGATALVIAGSLIGKLRDLSARVAAQLASLRIPGE